MHNIKIPQKNKSLSLFHIDGFSLNKNFDEFSPTETYAGGNV